MKTIEITPEEWKEIQRMLEEKYDWVKQSNTKEFAELMWYYKGQNTLKLNCSASLFLQKLQS